MVEERGDDVHGYREDDRRVLLGRDVVQCLQVPQLKYRLEREKKRTYIQISKYSYHRGTPRLGVNSLYDRSNCTYAVQFLRGRLICTATKKAANLLI